MSIKSFFQQLFSCNKQQQQSPVIGPPTLSGSSPGTRSNAIPVAVINQSTFVTDTQVQTLVEALQVQVSRDFAPAFGVDAQLTFVPKGQTPPTGMWWLVLSDTSDQAGALGYHDLTSEGLPIGKVFVKSDIDSGSSWSVTVSHELLEMLADPWINLCVFVQNSNTAGKLYSYEVCDACEADQFGYQINGQLVSDFVYPEWWGVPGSQRQFDFMGHITSVLQILSGGYIGEFDVTNGSSWTQKTASHGRISARRLVPQHGSRRERRLRGHTNWSHSTAHQPACPNLECGSCSSPTS